MGEVMPLTPEDVSNKRFTPVRLREGYDMGEVDQFLDEVEAELARLTKENDDLRSKLSSAQGAPMSERAPERPRVEEKAPEPVRAPEPAPTPVVAASPVETIRVETVPEAAKNEADRIVGEARTKAERLESESKGKADRLEADARTRAQMLDSETAERRQQMFGDLEKERDKLNSEVENLRSFEREYRSRLKSYFTQQLEALTGSSEATVPSDEQRAPKRLRSILGEDEG